MEMRANTFNWEQINGWREIVVQSNGFLELECVPCFYEMVGS